MITRRHLLAGSALPAWTTSGFAAKKKAPLRPKPNIILILADDLASWMIGCYGNREIRTPQIDHLARTGMRFINHFVATPICSASRATFLTGRLPSQHGIHDFLTDQPIEKPPQGQKDVPASFAREVMISDVLANAGYRCGYVGKWHLGDGRKLGHGYDFTYTMEGGSAPYQNPVLFLNGERRQETGYLAELITRRAMEFLDRQDPSRPFFLTVSHLNPHTSYDGHPQRYYDLYANTTFETVGFEPAAPNALREKEMLSDPVGNLRKCAAAVTALDDQVGALIQHLRQRKLDPNTLVIFTGDNGFLLGRHGLWSKGLASDPINMYEEVIQVPMIWSWPGRVPSESSRPELIASYDLMPTLCEAAGVEPPARNLCGRSYLQLAEGLIHGKNDRPWRNLVFGSFRNTEMVRDDRFKLILRDSGEGLCELFDLAQDPRERLNHYENPGYLTVRNRLQKELDDWRQRYTS